MGNILALQVTKHRTTADALSAFRSWNSAQVEAVINEFKSDSTCEVEIGMSLKALNIVLKEGG